MYTVFKRMTLTFQSSKLPKKGITAQRNSLRLPLYSSAPPVVKKFRTGTR
jgi:hypothetical protein